MLSLSKPLDLFLLVLYSKSPAHVLELITDSQGVRVKCFKVIPESAHAERLVVQEAHKFLLLLILPGD